MELSWSPFLEAWPLRQSKAIIRPERSGGRRERNSQHSAWRIAECSEVGWEWRRSLWAPNPPLPRQYHFLCLYFSVSYTVVECSHTCMYISSRVLNMLIRTLFHSLCHWALWFKSHSKWFIWHKHDFNVNCLFLTVQLHSCYFYLLFFSETCNQMI